MSAEAENTKPVQLPQFTPASQDSLLSYTVLCPKLSAKKRATLPYIPLVQKSTNSFCHYQYDSPTRSWVVKEMMVQCITKELFHIFDTEGHKESIDSLLNGPYAKTWSGLLTNEFGHLAQGINDVKDNDVVDFISRSYFPSDCVVTHANMVCDYRQNKKEQH